MNDDSSLRSSRVMLTAGIVICSVLAVCSLMNLTPGRLPGVLSVGREKPAAIREANRQLSKSYAEFYPSQPRSTGTIRTVSQSEEQPIVHRSAAISEPQYQHDVFQKDHIIDLDRAEQAEVSSSVHHSSRMTTSTTVEAGGDFASAAGEGSVNTPSRSSDRDASAFPLPHITVPVTVNVDNGEILTELMRLQEEVIVTRQQLADSGETATTSPGTVAKEPADAPQPVFEPASPAEMNAGSADSVVVETKAAVRTVETSESVASPESAIDVFSSSDGQASEPQTVEAETVPDFAATPEPADVAANEPEIMVEPELPDFGDFSAPNSGPSDDAAEENLPAFELPPQTKASRSSSLNSYAEWVQSFEETQSEQVTQVTYEEELPSFPSIEVNPVTAEPAASEAVTPLLTIPSEPAFDTASITVSNEQPSTPVPPVPARSVDVFHEPSTIPVFPVTSSKTELVTQPSTSASEKQASGNTQIPTVSESKSASSVAKHPTTGTRKSISKVTTARSQQAQRATGKPSSYQSQTEQKSGPSIASRLKGFGGPSDSQSAKSPGMIARMKSRMSTAVSKVPKPDFDTPMWVDRLADWKDERFGKKSATGPETASPSTAIASQLPPSRSSGHQHSMAQNAPTGSRSGSVRQPVNRVPGANSNAQIARSTSQPRANVTTVPRSGRPQSQAGRMAVVQAPQPPQKPAALTVQTQPVPSSPVAEKSEQKVSGASYSNDASRPAQKPITQTAHSTVSVPPAALPPAALPQVHRSQPGIVRAPANLPPGVQQGRDAYYGVVTESDDRSVMSMYSGQVPQQPHVSYPVVQEQVCDAPKEYVGTLDAFNYRMTMVIRPPDFSNPGLNPVSRWFSNANPATSGGASPAVHRVSSAIRYSTQPKTVR